MMGESGARPAGGPVGAELKQSEFVKDIARGSAVQVIDAKTGRRVGVLIAGRQGWLAFGVGFAALVHRGGFEQRWHVAADKMTEVFRHA